MTHYKPTDRIPPVRTFAPVILHEKHHLSPRQVLLTVALAVLTVSASVLTYSLIAQSAANY